MSKPEDKIFITRGELEDAVATGLSRGCVLAARMFTRAREGEKIREMTIEQLKIEAKKIIKSIS